MDWQPAPDTLLELVQENFDDEIVDACFARMSFYKDGYLVRAEFRDRSTRWVVFGGAMGAVASVVLDGTVTQIRAANLISGLNLQRENVADYTRFFCAHLRADEGSFQVVEDAGGMCLVSGHRLRDMSVKVRHQAEDGSFRVGAFHRYGGDLYRVSLRVPLDGAVEMLADIELGKMARLN